MAAEMNVREIRAALYPAREGGHLLSYCDRITVHFPRDQNFPGWVHFPGNQRNVAAYEIHLAVGSPGGLSASPPIAYFVCIGYGVTTYFTFPHFRPQLGIRGRKREFAPELGPRS